MAIYIFGMLLSLLFVSAFMNAEVIVKKIELITKRKISIKVTENIFKIMSFLPLFIISAFRYQVGTDYSIIYEDGFVNYTNSYNYNEHFEIGFKFLNDIIHIFTDNPRWLFIITSFIFCFFIYKAIYDQSEDKIFSVILLLSTNLYFVSLNGIRQAMAIAIFIYCSKYIKQRKIINYMLWVIVAITFHFSAIIYIPLYFIVNLEIESKRQAIFIAILFLFRPIVTWLITLIIENTRYSVYINSSFNTGNISKSLLVINVIILLVINIGYERNKKDIEYRMYTILELLTVSMLIFSNVLPLIDRLIWNLSFSTIIFMPNIIKKLGCSKKIQNGIKIAICVIFIIYMVKTIQINGNHSVIPYRYKLDF